MAGNLFGRQLEDAHPALAAASRADGVMMDPRITRSSPASGMSPSVMTVRIGEPTL